MQKRHLEDLMAAAIWWKNNYANLRKGGEFLINLMNEWGSHTLTSNAYASAYNAALEIVRQVYSGTVIIDAPGWGHEATVAANAVTGESCKFVIKYALRFASFHK